MKSIMALRHRRSRGGFAQGGWDARLRLFLAAVVCTIALPFVAAAQTGAMGSVIGEVRSEATGAAFFGAIIELEGSTGRITAIADPRGSYRLLDVPPGRSTLRVQQLGYHRLELEV